MRRNSFGHITRASASARPVTVAAPSGSAVEPGQMPAALLLAACDTSARCVRSSAGSVA
ncbi:hypothetical protein ACIBI9_17890 [Nonomuraea sp. NPDC050451]|uniref:hypothetical protein n=1 Tax=Nonomuraea sp. NPDC050451 TaxID=3364364 RepID=UPI00378AE463